jgi:hypothetical protein
MHVPRNTGPQVATSSCALRVSIACRMSLYSCWLAAEWGRTACGSQAAGLQAAPFSRVALAGPGRRALTQPLTARLEDAAKRETQRSAGAFPTHMQEDAGMLKGGMPN